MSRPADQDAEVRELVEASIGKRRMGVDYGFDVAWQPVQAQLPNGAVQNIVVYTIVLTRRSPLLGEPRNLFHLAQIPSPRPTAEQVDEQVADGIRQLAALYESMKRPPDAPPAVAGAAVALSNGRRG
jgi:hypothetical protein